MYGLDLYAAAQKPEGQTTEVSYMFSRPRADQTPVPNVTYVAKAVATASFTGERVRI